MSNRKDDERYQKKIGGNDAARDFVSPFMNNDINNASNSNGDIAGNKDIDDHSNNNIDSDITNDVDINNDSNVNSDIASNNDSNSETAVSLEPTKSSLDALLDGHLKAASSKVFKGFYLDPDIAKVLDKLARKHGKGIQSQVVNESLRMVFLARDLL